MRRPLLALFVLAVATVGGIATASALLPRAAPFETAPEHLQPGPGEALIGAHSPDPAGGPDWAVRTYISQTGGLCAEAGRLLGGVFGDITADGGFQPRPQGPTGTCAHASTERLIAAIDHVPDTPGQAARTVLFGASTRHLRQLRVSPEAIAPTELELGARGAFVAAFPGLRPAETLPVEARFGDGSVVRVDWSSPEHVLR